MSRKLPFLLTPVKQKAAQDDEDDAFIAAMEKAIVQYCLDYNDNPLNLVDDLFAIAKILARIAEAVEDDEPAPA